jgi:hypothetical protein
VESDLPEGWDDYEPDSNELSGDPEYQSARRKAANDGERRRTEHETSPASMRQPGTAARGGC